MDNVRTAQGTAWNYVSAEDMADVQAVILRTRIGVRPIMVNHPNGVHLRSNGHVVTVKAFDSRETVTFDYHDGGGIIGVMVRGKLYDMTLSNFGTFAPRGIQQIHLCAINNS